MGVCVILLNRTIETDLKSEVISLVIVLRFFLDFCFIACTRYHGKWKKVSQSVLTLSENEEDGAGFYVMPCFIVLYVGDFVVATFSVEMSVTLTCLDSFSIYHFLLPPQSIRLLVSFCLTTDNNNTSQ